MRKLLLNCDQVFDVLTRGPFPSGDETDQPVESHLRACHECRQLAEALQPAVYLLHESLSAKDCEELPRYQGVLSAIEQDREILRDLRGEAPSGGSALSASRPPAPRTAQSLEAGLILRTLASVLLLVTVGVASWSLVTTLSATRLHPLAAAGDAAGGRQAEQVGKPRGIMLLASLDLPSTCFPREWSARLESASHGSAEPSIGELALAGFRCCTECHHGGAKGASPTSEQAAQRDPNMRLVAVVQESCAACHTPSTQAL
jgi:hypothetical protein